MITDAKPIIVVKDLAVGYGETIIMENLNFSIRPGEVFVILGGSGCGKTTVMRSMIGLVEPARGSVFIDGTDIVSAAGKERREVLQKIGVMYQNGALFGSMDLIENISLVLEEYTKLTPDAMKMIARMKLKLVGLSAAGLKMPSELSGGMRKRAAIARAMALDPQIIFLDEPSAGLDPITSAQMDELILALSKSTGVTFVVVTHELPSIFTIADTVIMLDRSARTIIATGPPAYLRDHSDNQFVRQFFNRQSEKTPETQL